MSERIKLVQGDTRPAIICKLTNQSTGVPIALVGAQVQLNFRAAEASTIACSVIGTITDGPNGEVAFFPASAPEMLQGEPGNYDGEIQITFSDGQIQTVYDLLKFKVRGDF